MTHQQILHDIITGFADLPGVLFRLNVVGAAAGGRYIRSAPKGVSDLIGFLSVDGRAVFVAIEVKAGPDKLRPEQASFLAELAPQERAAAARESQRIRSELLAAEAWQLSAVAMIDEALEVAADAERGWLTSQRDAVTGDRLVAEYQAFRAADPRLCRAMVWAGERAQASVERGWRNDESPVSVVWREIPRGRNRLGPLRKRAELRGAVLRQRGGTAGQAATYGVHSDIWAALALAVTWWDTRREA